MIEATGPAAIYVRISDDPDLERLGVQRQERECRELAERLGWEVGQIYEDDDRSAFKANVTREGYRSLMADLKAGKWKRLIAWHPDRIHRQPRELEDFIDVVSAAGVEIRTVRAGDLDLSTPDGRMTARIMGSVATRESEHRSARIRSAMRELRANGSFTGGPRPFGWEADGVTERPSEVTLLREAKDRVLKGDSLRGICLDWTRRGIRTTRGNDFVITSLRKTLTSHRVVGLYSTREKKVIGKAQWCAIFTPDEFARVRAILFDPERNMRARREARAYLLVGILRCGLCGGPMYGRPAFGGRPVPYYGCRSKGCGKVHIAVPQADRAVEGQIFAAMESAELRDRILAPPDGSVAEAEAEFADSQTRLAELANMFGTSAITADEYRTARGTLQDRQEKAQAVLDGARGQMSEMAGLSDLVGFKAVYEAYEIRHRRRLLDQLISRVNVRPHRGPQRRPDPDRVSIVWRRGLDV